MTSRAAAVRTVVEAMWEHAEEVANSDLLNPEPDYIEKFNFIQLGCATLTQIVRTLSVLDVSPDEVLTAVRAWSEERSTEKPRYKKSYLRVWTNAVEIVHNEMGS